MGNFLKLGLFGEVENVIAAIVQVIASATDSADGGIACGCARQGDGFFGFR